MKLAVVADLHVDAGSRFSECVRVLDFIADDCAARGVDVVAVAGDVYERKSTPDERRVVAAWVQRLATFAPVVIIRGNHDAPRDLELLARLDTKHEVIVEEAAGVHCVGGAVFGCLSWPSKANVLAMAQAVSQQEGEQAAADALRVVLLGLGQQMDAVREARGMGQAPKILLAHAMVRGSKVSTGQPLVGCDLELGLEDLALARADFYGLGHIHMPQDWIAAGEPRDAMVAYPGSPRRTAFGEVEQKGYIVAEFEPGLCCTSWERVPTPCASMVLLEDQWQQDDKGGWWVRGPVDDANEGVCNGAEVRFRYSVRADERDAGRAAAQERRDLLLDLGAVEVKVEERVIASAHARAPEVAQAETLGDKLCALWRARQTTPEPPRDERLIAMAEELKDAV